MEATHSTQEQPTPQDLDSKAANKGYQSPPSQQQQMNNYMINYQSPQSPQQPFQLYPFSNQQYMFGYLQATPQPQQYYPPSPLGNQKNFTENSAFRSPEVRNYQMNRNQQFDLGNINNFAGIGDFDNNQYNNFQQQSIPQNLHQGSQFNLAPQQGLYSSNYHPNLGQQQLNQYNIPLIGSQVQQNQYQKVLFPNEYQNKQQNIFSMRNQSDQFQQDGYYNPLFSNQNDNFLFQQNHGSQGHFSLGNQDQSQKVVGGGRKRVQKNISPQKKVDFSGSLNPGVLGKVGQFEESLIKTVPKFQRVSEEGGLGLEVSLKVNGNEAYKVAIKKSRVCNCKRSKCLKLYCDCFSSGEHCGQECNCVECNNIQEFQKQRYEAITQILEKNPEAFSGKIKQDEKTISKLHKKGCNCKRSNCLKKYCECYQANVYCSEYCKCEECKNLPQFNKDPSNKEKPFYLNQEQKDNQNETQNKNHLEEDPVKKKLFLSESKQNFENNPNEEKINKTQNSQEEKENFREQEQKNFTLIKQNHQSTEKIQESDLSENQDEQQLETIKKKGFYSIQSNPNDNTDKTPQINKFNNEKDQNSNYQVLCDNIVKNSNILKNNPINKKNINTFNENLNSENINSFLPNTLNEHNAVKIDYENLNLKNKNVDNFISTDSASKKNLDDNDITAL